jgi:hypothetical protein
MSIKIGRCVCSIKSPHICCWWDISPTLLFIWMGWDCVWTAATNGLLFIPEWWVWSHSGIILTGESRRTRRKPFPSASLPTTNPTWTDLGANPGFRGERPATNHPSHGTALRIFILFIYYLFLLSDPRRFVHPDIWWRVQTTSCVFSSSLVTSSLLLLITLPLNTLHLCSSLGVLDPITYPCKKRQNYTFGPPSFISNGIPFLGVKHGRGVTLTTPPSRADVKNEYALCVLSPLAPAWRVAGAGILHCVIFRFKVEDGKLNVI